MLRLIDAPFECGEEVHSKPQNEALPLIFTLTMNPPLPHPGTGVKDCESTSRGKRIFD